MNGLRPRAICLLSSILLLLCVRGLFAADDPLDAKMKDAEEVVWKRFYSSQTNLFYDYITSYEEGEELAHLPRPDEVARQYPNPCGYGTGMEDCMISAGVMMTAVLNRYRCDGYAEGPRRAEEIFLGIERSVRSVPGEGFVARGYSPFAPDLFYIGSSRDQVTHAVTAMWEYYRSGLPSESIKKRLRQAITEIAERMRRNVTPENHYDFLRADGSPCPHGICKMEEVMPHEAARLVMIYAAAWDMTGGKAYHDLWREKIRVAAEGSLHPKNVTTYGLLQMQDSLALLDALEPDAEIKRTLRKAAAEASDEVFRRIPRLEATRDQFDLTLLAPDWREVGGLVDPYRSVWYYPRERGEVLLTLLGDPETPYSAEVQAFLRSSVEMIDFHRNSSCGLFDILAAWWKWRASFTPK